MTADTRPHTIYPCTDIDARGLDRELKRGSAELLILSVLLGVAAPRLRGAARRIASRNALLSGKPALMRLVFVSRERNRRAAREPWLEEMSLTPGAQCGGYEIVGLLGTGGMGEVYRARDLKLGRQVAIKVLGVEALANPGAVRRFQHEARAASALNHPGIVTIHDVGELDGQFFIVMELVEGSTLRQLLGRGRAPLKKTLQIASQMADALAKAHEAGIVHCDLKPENAMLTDEGHVKIVDFGLAKLTDPAASAPAAADGPDGDRTTERIVFGTVGYMSPEQASGGIADFRADQFAFGAILYEMATGSRAFHKDTGAETLSMIIRGEPERPLDLNPSLPLPLVWIIERCLSKDPADRYVSTRDLARDVQTLREHTTHRNALEVPRLATRIRRPWLVAAVAALRGAERCGNARVLRDAGRSGQCSRERVGAKL